MLKAKELLSGVKRTSKVVALIPLLSIHVASEFDPICRNAWAECRREKRKREKRRKEETDDKGERETLLCVRFGKDMRIVVVGDVRSIGNTLLRSGRLRMMKWSS